MILNLIKIGMMMKLYSHIIELYCYNNQLQKLPDNLHNCQILNCSNNRLHKLPNNLHNCKVLYCNNNNFIIYFNNLEEYKQLWKFQRFYFSLK